MRDAAAEQIRPIPSEVPSQDYEEIVERNPFISMGARALSGSFDSRFIALLCRASLRMTLLDYSSTPGRHLLYEQHLKMLPQLREAVHRKEPLRGGGWARNLFVLQHPGIVVRDEDGVQSGGECGIDV